MKKWIRLFSLAFVAILVNIGSNRHFDKFSYSQVKEHYLWQNHHKLVHFLAFSKTWRDSLIPDSIPAQELLAIVYPEILRHSTAQDTFETQIMQAFYQIVSYRFPHYRDLPSEERVRFLASAYNRGFLCSEAEIKRFYSIKLYPYGASKLKKYYYGKGNFCSYSELAVYGFQKVID